ncbi:hypothetical protein GCM10009830_45430 [Glycomyces endophyticus]|uniref:Uncharacterized protein n=1 Tax=Glycomyces endophyticus TaxID=480996 RepID=A0ABP4TSA3_9ACTN
MHRNPDAVGGTAWHERGRPGHKGARPDRATCGETRRPRGRRPRRLAPFDPTTPGVALVAPFARGGTKWGYTGSVTTSKLGTAPPTR